MITLPCDTETVNEDGGSSMSWPAAAIYSGGPGLNGRILGCSTIAGESSGLWVKGTEGNGEGKEGLLEETEGNAVSFTDTL